MQGRPCLASLIELARIGAGVSIKKNICHGLLQLGCQVGILELNLLQVGFCNFPFISPLLYRCLQWIGLI